MYFSSLLDLFSAEFYIRSLEGQRLLYRVKYAGNTRHFGSYQESKLSVTQRKGRYSLVKSSQLSWAGQYKKCVQTVQYDFQFTLEYSEQRWIATSTSTV